MSQKLNTPPSAANGGRQIDYAPHLHSAIERLEDGDNGNMHRCKYWHTAKCSGWNSAHMCSGNAVATCFYARAAGVAELGKFRSERSSDERGMESGICVDAGDLSTGSGHRQGVIADQALTFRQKISCCIKDICWRLQTAPVSTWKSQLDESINSYFPILLEIENGRSNRR